MESVSVQASNKVSLNSVAVQAFEEDPLQGLLSKEEICELVEVDRLIGNGIKDCSESEYVDHTITCKRAVVDGIVYQVLIVKEQYVKEIDSSTREGSRET